ncbi:SAM-dependent methyltransferase [Streptomyces sp. NPDC057781]|uniref:SAM-dependent methyltransferase n=1 Tax=unclassified Streptomyces TaxID=2593676 RepID=UPI0036AA32F8
MNSTEYMAHFTSWADRIYAQARDSWTDTDEQRYAARLMLGTLAAGSRVLDIGTGRGRDVAVLAGAGHEAVGLDLTPLEEWEKIRADCARASFEVRGFMDYRPTSAFDAVLDSGCFHHQHPDDLNPYLEKVRDILVPGGSLWLNVFRRRSEDCAFTENPIAPWTDGRYIRTYVESTVRALLTGHGFVVVSQTIIERDDLRAEIDDMLVHAVRPKQKSAGTPE